MHSYKHYIRFGCLALVLVCAGVVFPDSVFAAPVGAAVVMPTGVEAGIASIVAKIIGFLNILIWVLFIFLNYILDPQFIFNLDGSGGLMTMLNKIWQLSRDLMNVAFALILIGTAVYTIVTANKEFVTSHAKKFIMAIVLVNFSWFFPMVILDVANVATATIYGIPSLLFTGSAAADCTYQSSMQENSSCKAGTPDPDPTKPILYTCDCMAVTDARMFMSDADRDTLIGLGWTCQAGIICIQSSKWDPTIISGHSAILNGLIVNHAHLQQMASVPGPVDSSDIGQMTRFLMAEALILLIHIAMFFPLLAMFVAFLIRIPILWLTMAFMPFIFLNWVMEGNELAGTTKRIWDEFIKAAFLPAMVAIPLSVGFILVNAGDQLSPTPIAGIQIRLIDSVSNYWELLWWMMTLGVLWVGTFAVFEKAGGLYAKTASTFKSFGESLGSLAVKAPLSIPIIPGMRMTPLAAMRAFHPQAIESSISGREGFRGFMNDLRGGGGGALASDTLARDLVDQQEKDRRLELLHTDLEKLAHLMETGGSKQDIETAIRNLKTDHKVDISTSNPGADLKEFVDKMKKAGLNNANRGKYDTVVDRIRNAPPIPPATPPPPPVPPVPPTPPPGT